MIGHDLHLDWVAQIGLVGAVPKGRILVGDLLPLLIDFSTAAEFLEDAADDRLDRVKDILLCDKGHLHVELVEIRRRAVGARVFVAEAGRDLEIFVEPRHHQQLFELLRRLRQGVEFAGMQARGHQKVTRAFGRRRGDDRCLKFAELLIPHPLADRRDHVGAQDHVVLHLLPAQIKVTIA